MKRTNTVSKNRIIGTSVSYNIVMLGAGNVSTHFSRHLHSSGHRISCIYSRSVESSSVLANELGTLGTNKPGDVPQSADFYIVCVSDSAVASVVNEFRDRKGIWVHTAGALPMDLFKEVHTRYGVLYPLQSLSKECSVTMEKIPFLVEGSSPELTASISRLAYTFTEKVHEMDSATRLVIHLAAAFANNFSNHMAYIGQHILRERELDEKLLEPILEETYRKIGRMGAKGAQTGPALRDDKETMNKHIELLKHHPEWEKLYTFISRDIDRSRED